MGIRQHLKMEKYDWDVYIYYTVDEGQKSEILTKMYEMGCDGKVLTSIKTNLENAAEDTGFTYSSYSKRCSVLVIHKASSVGEFISTFEHEKNHLEMHICEALDINPYSEKAAYMSGEIAKLILEKALYSIVNL